MRRFGTDKPKLMAFRLGDSKKVYTMPLAASMPANILIKMGDTENNDTEAFKFQYKLLKKYIGDVADDLTAGDIRDIFNAWSEASEAEQGAEVGES